MFDPGQGAGFGGTSMEGHRPVVALLRPSVTSR